MVGLEWMINDVHHAPCELLMQLMPDASIDLIIADQPYGIGYKACAQRSNGGEVRRASSSFGDDVLNIDWINEAERVLKPGGAMYIFSRWDVLHHTVQACKDASLSVHQRIVWDKRHWGMGNLRYFGSQTEDILFVTKGNHDLRWSKRAGNVWTLNKMDSINNEGNFDNPTQKPEKLLRWMILHSSDKGQIVFDPFCGSGSTAAAARTICRDWITCDVSLYQVNIARERLKCSAEIYPSKRLI